MTPLQTYLLFLTIFTILIAIVGSAFSTNSSSLITSLEKENDRQWDYYREMSGSISEIAPRFDKEVEGIYRAIKELEKNSAKIYNLEVTLCILDEENNVINKRNVVMNNIVGINPSIDRASEVVATGMGYGSSVDIPTIRGSMEEYACGLRILSIR